VRYHNEEKAGNSRLDELQAALLRPKLRRLDEWNARRASLAAEYRSLLGGLAIVIPAAPAGLEHAWHLFVVRAKARDKLREDLAARGVETQIHYPLPPHLQPAYRDLAQPAGSFPLSESIHREVLSLPIGPHHTTAQVRYVAQAVRECLPD
jgi:dTDP-4-amino-4,6-dideoxygalactose transaminase